MKYLVKFFVVTFLLLVSTHVFAEKQIVYLDMKFVLNNSKAGKGAQDFLKKSFAKSQKEFIKKEKALKKDEADLLAKKDVLTKEEYNEKAEKLRTDVIEYQNKRRTAIDKITKQRSDARQELLEKLNPILNAYIQENNIAFILDKKNILGGSVESDITNIIVEKLNKELPSLNLK